MCNKYLCVLNEIPFSFIYGYKQRPVCVYKRRLVKKRNPGVYIYFAAFKSLISAATKWSLLLNKLPHS